MANPIQTASQVAPRVAVDRPFGPPQLAQSGDGVQGSSFKDTLERALGETQGMQDTAGDAVQAFLRGEPVELHDVMAAVEEAGIALEMLIAVRDRMVEAYRTVVNMQT